MPTIQIIDLVKLIYNSISVCTDSSYSFKSLVFCFYEIRLLVDKLRHHGYM